VSFLDREEAVRELLHAARVMKESGFLPATDGNFSARISPTRAIITVSGIEKHFLTENDFIATDISEEHPPRGSSEWRIHRAIYLARPEINCILHAHSPALTSFAAARKIPNMALLAEAVATLSEIVLVPYHTPGTSEIADELIRKSLTAGVYILSNHGPVVVGDSIRETLHRFERAEHLAKVEINASRIGGGIPLSKSEIKALSNSISQ
jgi:L-fuculose-phosphate aldolase